MIYQLSRCNRADVKKDPNRKTINVHYSRVIPLAEGALDSEIDGISSIEPVFNRLLDWEKVVGGSSEAVYQNANTPICFRN